jgi:F-type H+-transporting ATPase subunit beta
VGKDVLGHVFNALGQRLDVPTTSSSDTQRGEDTPKGKKAPQTLPIHRSAPRFVDLSTRQEILETGIKVIDLLAPILKGGKV